MIFRGNALALATVILTAIPLAGEAIARDRFVGDWTKECEPHLQCWAEISRSARSGRYVFDYFAASRTNANDVFCRKTATLKRSGSSLIASAKEGSALRIEPGPDGGIRVKGAGSCRENAVDGHYGALGDI